MQCAQEERADLIVVGMSSHGSLADLVFGSTARRLEKEAHRPVVAVPPDWPR